jgi:DNA-directed RNA polymerase III subunit RPC8
MMFLSRRIICLKGQNCKAPFDIRYYTINMSSDHLEQVWIWNNEGEAYYMDKNEEIRFRVEDEKFRDQTPRAPVKPGETEVESEQSREASYQIICSCNQAGLGLVSWW